MHIIISRQQTIWPDHASEPNAMPVTIQAQYALQEIS